MTTRSALADATPLPAFASGAHLPRPGSRLTRLGLLGFANAIRVPGRFALLVLTLALGGALYLSAENVGRSFHETLAVTEAGMGYDVTVVLDGRIDAAATAALVGRAPGVARPTTSVRARGLLVDSMDPRPNAFAVRGIAESLPRRLEQLRGRWLGTRDHRAVVANHAWVRDHPRIGVGDSLTVTIAGVTDRWQLVGSVRELMTGPTLYAPAASLESQVAGRKHATDVAVALTSHGTAAERRAIDAIDSTLATDGIRPLAISDLQSVREGRENHALVIVRFLVMLAGLAQLVGGLGLATMLSVSVFERSREIGVMRSIGATRWQLMVLVIIEGACIAIAGAAAAALLSVPLTWVLDQVFGRMMVGTPLDLDWSPSAFRGLAVMVSVIALVASGMPAWMVSRRSPRALLADGG